MEVGERTTPAPSQVRTAPTWENPLQENLLQKSLKGENMHMMTTTCLPMENSEGHTEGHIVTYVALGTLPPWVPPTIILSI